MRSLIYVAVAVAMLLAKGVADAQSPAPGTANRYILFIHSGGWSDNGEDPTIVKRVASALAQRGYLVRPPDAQRDDTGGAGIDYFAEADKDIAQDVANVVNNVLYKDEPKVHPRLQRIKNPAGYIGVWLYSRN
jgi:hypothetical protein